MKKILSVLTFILIFTPPAIADCKKTGSSFSRNSQNCGEEYIENNNYTYNNYYYYDNYPRPYYRAPAAVYDNSRERRINPGHKFDNSSEDFRNRGYAPGWGTSFSMPR